MKQLPSEALSSFLSKEKSSESDRFENRGSKEASQDSCHAFTLPLTWKGIDDSLGFLTSHF